MAYITGANILAHPNIPTPLHGLAPRVIYGSGWWNKVRKLSYAQNDNRCWACGVHLSQAKYHQWLEAHEFYDIDYENGKMYFKHAVALCHSCHNFIHSQRLLAILKKGEIRREKAFDIVDRGLNICFENGVTPFIGSKGIIDELGLKWADYWTPEPSKVNWSDWRLVLDHKEYAPIWNTIDDWAKNYRVVLTEEDRQKWYH